MILPLLFIIILHFPFLRLFSVVFSFAEVTLISIIPLPLIFAIPHTQLSSSCSCPISILLSLSYVLSLSFGLYMLKPAARYR